MVGLIISCIVFFLLGAINRIIEIRNGERKTKETSGGLTLLALMGGLIDGIVKGSQKKK